jgi:hypothetical protein
VLVSVQSDLSKITSEPRLIVNEISYSPVKVGDFYVPERVSVYSDGGESSGDDPRVTYEYSNISLNQPLGANEFLIDWKKGTMVDDEVTSQRYIASDKPIDEAEAVNDFMVAHGIKCQGLFDLQDVWKQLFPTR